MNGILNIYASLILTSHSGTCSCGVIEHSKSIRVAHELEERENAKLASSKKDSSMMSGLLTAATVIAVALEALSDSRREHHSGRAEPNSTSIKR